VLTIAIIEGYLAWPSKRVSHLITNPSKMISIIIKIQASITGEVKDNLGEYEENATEKQKRYKYIGYNTSSPSNQAIGMANTKFKIQEGSNQNTGFSIAKDYTPPEIKANQTKRQTQQKTQTPHKEAKREA
jgi:hypothetical protein